MNRWHLITLAILLLGSTWLWSTRVPEHARAEERTAQPALNHPAPEFTLQELDGSTLAMADLRGRPVVLNFWATWCFPCREEMPMLQTTWERYGDAVAIIGVDAGEEAPVVQSFVDDLGVTFPIILDNQMATTTRYNVRGFPTTFFIDGNGIIRQIYPGQLHSAILAEGIQEILR